MILNLKGPTEYVLCPVGSQPARMNTGFEKIALQQPIPPRISPPIDERPLFRDAYDGNETSLPLTHPEDHNPDATCTSLSVNPSTMGGASEGHGAGLEVLPEGQATFQRRSCPWGAPGEAVAARGRPGSVAAGRQRAVQLADVSGAVLEDAGHEGGGSSPSTCSGGAQEGLPWEGAACAQ